MSIAQTVQNELHDKMYWSCSNP